MFWLTAPLEFSQNDLSLVINSVLLRYITANKWMHDEAKTLLEARADQRHKKSKKYDEKYSILNAHGRTAKYWTAGLASLRASVGINYFDFLILIFSYKAVPKIKDVLSISMI